MRSPDMFIVRPLDGRRYDNIKDIGGVDFITSTSKEDHTVSNRFAEVISLPINYDGPVRVKDIFLVHHNVFKVYYDMKGVEKSGASFFKDDMFFIDDEQYFMYKQDGKWNTHSKYCFVKPVLKKNSLIDKNSKEEPLMGTIRYINQKLLDYGLSIGDEISFEPDSEYPFYVDGEKLYRMLTNNITIKWTTTQ
jgi:hypothetical protein